MRCETAKHEPTEDSLKSVARTLTGLRSSTAPKIPNPNLCDQYIGPDFPFTLYDLHTKKEHENVEFIRKDGKLVIQFLNSVKVDECVKRRCIKIKPNGILKLSDYGESPLHARVTIFNVLNFEESYLRRLCLEEGVEFVSYSSIGPFGEFQYITSSVGSLPAKESVRNTRDVFDEDASFVPRLPVINPNHIQDLASAGNELRGSEEDDADEPRFIFNDRPQYAINRRDYLLEESPDAARLIEGLRFPIHEHASSSSKCEPCLSLYCAIPGDVKKIIRVACDYNACYYAALIEVLLRRVQHIKKARGERFALSPDALPWRVVDGESESGLSEFCESMIKILGKQEYGKYLQCPTGLKESVESEKIHESKLAPLLEESIVLHANLQKDRISHEVSILPDEEDSVQAVISLVAILLSNSACDITDQVHAWVTQYVQKGNVDDTCMLGSAWLVHLLAVLSRNEGLDFVQCFRVMQHTVGSMKNESTSSQWAPNSLSYALLDWYCNDNEENLIFHLLRDKSDWALSFITAVLVNEHIDMPLNEIGSHFYTQLLREGLFGCAAIACFFLPDGVLREKLLSQLPITE